MMKTTPPASVKELNKTRHHAYLYSKGPATKQMLERELNLKFAHHHTESTS